jgi:hypothetical protein
MMLAGLLIACALGVDGPGEETANRKLLALWKSEPDRMARLQQNAQALQAMSPEQQERLRQLDRDLHHLDPATQARLRVVMERYAGWVSRLSREDRHRISAVEPGPERLKLVEELLEKQWQEALPKPDLEKLAKATGEERLKLLEQLHKDEDERNKLRLQARRTIEEAAVLGPLPFGQPEFRNRVESFVDESLKPLLNRQEEERLMAMSKGTWQRYFQTIYEISEGRTPLPFPGPAPPGRKKALRSQLPLAVAATAKEKGLTIPWNTLGPTKLEELPNSVQKFVRDDLTTKLTDNEKRQLTEAQGTWPDYPMKIKELADKHRLQVPGLNLPGTRELWQNMLRAFRPKAGGLQDK